MSFTGNLVGTYPCNLGESGESGCQLRAVGNGYCQLYTRLRETVTGGVLLENLTPWPCSYDAADDLNHADTGTGSEYVPIARLIDKASTA